MPRSSDSRATRRGSGANRVHTLCDCLRIDAGGAGLHRGLGWISAIRSSAIGVRPDGLGPPAVFVRWTQRRHGARPAARRRSGGLRGGGGGAAFGVFLVRKLVAGARGTGDGRHGQRRTFVLNEQVVQALDIPDDVIRQAIEEQRREMERREVAYRGKRPAPDVQGRIAILVDDGLATGSTMRAARPRSGNSAGRASWWLFPSLPSRPASNSGRGGRGGLRCHSRSLLRCGPMVRELHQMSDEEVRELLLERARASGRRSARGREAIVPGPRRIRVSGDSSHWTAESRPSRGSLGMPPDARGRRPLRARQRQQPPQPAQPVRRRRSCSAPAWPRCSSICSPPRRKQRTCDTGQLRFDIALLGRPAGRRDRLAAAQDRATRAADRLLRREHRRGRRARGRGRTARARCGGRFARRAARPGRRRRCRASRRRRCSSSAATTRGHRPQPAARRLDAPHEAARRSSPARRTCSRSRARSNRSPSSRQSGSSSTWSALAAGAWASRGRPTPRGGNPG